MPGDYMIGSEFFTASLNGCDYVKFLHTELMDLVEDGFVGYAAPYVDATPRSFATLCYEVRQFPNQ